MSGPGPRVIGRIRTRHASFEHTPVQAALNPEEEEEGTIELDPRYLDASMGSASSAICGCSPGSHPTKANRPEPGLRQVPFLLRRAPRRLGILATRGPKRPTPIGLSLVRLGAVDGTTIRFAGVDMLGATPRSTSSRTWRGLTSLSARSAAVGSTP